MEGKVETKAIESKSDDEYDSSSEDISDLEDELMGDSVPIISLMDMYRQTFQEPDPLGDFQWAECSCGQSRSWCQVSSETADCAA